VEEAIDAACEGVKGERCGARLGNRAVSSNDPFDKRVSAGEDAREEQKPCAAEMGAMEECDERRDEERAEKVSWPIEFELAEADPEFREGVDAMIVDPVGCGSIESVEGKYGQEGEGQGCEDPAAEAASPVNSSRIRCAARIALVLAVNVCETNPGLGM